MIQIRVNSFQCKMMPFKYFISDQLIRKGNRLVSPFFNRQPRHGVCIVHCAREKEKDYSYIFRPTRVKESNGNTSNVGAELTGTLNKYMLKLVLKSFCHDEKVKQLAAERGLYESIQTDAMNRFYKYCLTSHALPVDLHVTLSDVIQSARNITDVFPYFLRYAKLLYPHIDCLDDLKKISDLRCPANWYPSARARDRKIIFHVGPTNSGKTYHALQRFMSAETGVYCGPLKLLAVEVFKKTNDMGTPCDLVTGEEKTYAKDEEHPAQHLSCSVEMVNLANEYEVAVIDEIQLMRDMTRGWAWTRALLGINAKEVHLCGEAAAIELVQKICSTTDESVEIREYERLTPLKVENVALRSLKNVRAGDCIVCFNKNDIFSVAKYIEGKGREVAVIYGSLPPGTKLAQAAKFNDPAHSCKILVATNAIGMGLNLHIQRIIFYSLTQPSVNEKGAKELDTISVSTALQIAGRAGRHGTTFAKGYVTTFKNEDLPILVELLKQKPEILTKAGLLPNFDQIELYAYHLPHATLSHLVDIFMTLCTVDDSLYFMCNMKDFKFLADMIEHIPISLHARYVFCCAPIDRKMPFTCSMFLKIVRQFSKNLPVNASWLCEQIKWPFRAPKNIADLVQLESVFDILDLYLWLSYRFPDQFMDNTLVKEMQKELDAIIQEGVRHITSLLLKTDSSSEADWSEIDFERLSDKQNFEIDTEERTFGYGSNLRNRKGKLTQKLISEGLLTPQMLRQLQEEWAKKLQGQKSGLIGLHRRTKK